MGTITNPNLNSMAYSPNSNYSFNAVRAAAILTTGAVAGTVLGLSDVNLYNNNQLIIYADFTIGSLTNVILTVEFSNDGTNWYKQTYEDVAASTGVATVRTKTHVLAATGKYRLDPITICDQFIRISATGTGTVTSSSLAVSAIIGNI